MISTSRLPALSLIWKIFAIVTFATLATAQDSTLVTKMAANEAATPVGATHYSYDSEETSSRTGGHRWRERVVETDDGPLHRLLLIDGKPLTQSQSNAEEDRIRELIRDPSNLRQANQAHLGDETRAAKLLGLLPKAFLFSPAGMQDGCVKFLFRPNPDFQPSTYEERIAHAMEGTVSLRQPMNRLCLLTATMIAPVEFGFGLLGKVESGGNLNLGRIPVDPVHWKSDYISVHIHGRILLLKTLARDQDVRRTNIRVIPTHLSLAQAAQLSNIQ